MLVYPLRLGLSAYFVAYLTASTFDTGLVVFGLSRLSLVIRYVHAARGELAQLAIVRERVRFSRDLHDLLGYSLSAITLKAELARRLVSANPGRSRDEIAELLDIARQALADVRTVSSGYRNISLSKEAASVASLLTTAGIDTQVEISCGPPVLSRRARRATSSCCGCSTTASRVMPPPGGWAAAWRTWPPGWRPSAAG
jgi:two-component system sensor histidine kinase DesK